MKRLFCLCLALLLCFGIMFYKQTPTYNPFDGVFDIDTSQLSECDTIGGMCGFLNFRPKTDKRLKMYYQIYTEDINDVIGKGFYYTEDTILIPKSYDYDSFLDSIKNLPIGIKEYNEVLNEFGYSYLDKNEYNIRIIHKTNFDIVTTLLRWDGLENDSTKIIRTIGNLIIKPRITRNSDNEFIIY
ncbi:hypothetical protein V9L05_11025 [Bernardetia sp. Wsw4-3y2]|uniref:hypothetical protein n=1 Tax=Bernardetia sp. Wsw4-3y2 TaxID=3127471 RepID=UPI0030D5395F